MPFDHDLLHAAQNPLEVERQLPRQFTTSNHSMYTLDENGHYSRFKTATGEQFLPSDITVFLDINDPHTEQHILRAAQKTGQIFIGELTTDDIKMITDVTQYEGGNLVVVAENSYTKRPEDTVVVRASLFPYVGGQVYEERRESELIYRHGGNQVDTIIQ